MSKLNELGGIEGVRKRGWHVTDIDQGNALVERIEELEARSKELSEKYCEARNDLEDFFKMRNAEVGALQAELKPLRELAKWIKGQPEGVYQISPGEWWWAQVKACEADDVVSLGQYIMDNIPGEPSRSEGAIATAIRIMTTMQAELRTLRELAYLVMNLNMELPERLVSKAREAEEVRSVKAG